MPKDCCVTLFGAVGNGTTDDGPAIQQALFSGASKVAIPKGEYRVCKTLRIPSDTEVVAEEGARIVHCGHTPRKRDDFLLTNADYLNGNENIRISGGVWDGGFGGPCAVKPADLFDEGAWSGACLNFVGVKNLILEGLTVANTVTYYIRMARLENFIIRNILFESRQKANNQDGLHFGGCVKNGFVENIRAAKGQTNDDLIALNADDSIVRLENRDLVRGDIENIYFRDIFAEDCYTAVRLLSVTAVIKNIRIENITCGCRVYAINMDAARYCKTPLFQEDDFPNGAGRIENVQIDRMTVYTTESNSTAPALIHCESQCKGLRITNFRRESEKDFAPGKATVLCKNAVNLPVLIGQGERASKHHLAKKSDVLQIDEPFDALFIG